MLWYDLPFQQWSDIQIKVNYLTNSSKYLKIWFYNFHRKFSYNYRFSIEIKQVSWSLPNCFIELWTISTLLIVHIPIDLNGAYKKNIVETKIIWRRFIRFEGNSLVKTTCSKHIQNSYSSCNFVIFFPFLIPLLNAMSVTYLCMTFIFFQFVHKNGLLRENWWMLLFHMLILRKCQNQKKKLCKPMRNIERKKQIITECFSCRKKSIYNILRSRYPNSSYFLSYFCIIHCNFNLSIYFILTFSFVGASKFFKF